MRQDARLGMSLINKRQVGLSKANDKREQHKRRESTVLNRPGEPGSLPALIILERRKRVRQEDSTLPEPAARVWAAAQRCTYT